MCSTLFIYIYMAGFGILSSVINAGTSRRAQKRQQQYERDNMALQNQYNIDMFNRQAEFNQQMYAQQRQDNIDFWNMQNEYNSAASQVERLKEAGLNPAMAMGNAGMSGDLTAPNALSSSAGSGVQGGSQLPYANVDMNFLDAALKLSQIKNIDEDTRKKGAERNKINLDSDFVKAQTQYQNTINKWSNLSEEQRIENLRASTKAALANSDKSEAEKNKLVEETKYIGQLSEAQIEKYRADTNKAWEEAKTEVAKRHNLSAQNALYYSQVALNRQLGFKAEADTALAKAQEGKTNKESDKIVEEIQSAYYHKVQDYIDTYNLSEGIDKHSLVGSAMMYIETKVDNITDSAVDSVEDLGNKLRLLMGIQQKQKSHHKRVRGSSIQHFNPSMQ